MRTENGLRTWIELNRKNLKHNLDLFSTLVGPDVKIMAVVKSNAYGHGLVDFSKEVDALGVSWFGVDSIVEAVRLREEGVSQPILVLGYTLPEKVPVALAHDITLTVSSFLTLEHWTRLTLSEKIKVHIKVDTGLHRQGFLKDEMKKVVTFLKDHTTSLEVTGLYTHFAKAKDPEDRAYTEEQLSEFTMWKEELSKAGFEFLSHAAASGSTLIYPQAHFDMVRIGAGLFGLWPSHATRDYIENKVKLKPVLSWKTLITEIKKLPEGSGIGYDLSEVLTRDSTIAICPIGYWHGFPRSLSLVGYVLLKGERVKVLGRVAMDMIVIDITHISDARVLDEVTLIGKDGDDEITAEEFAELAGTSNYEAVTRLNPLIQKMWK